MTISRPKTPAKASTATPAQVRANQANAKKSTGPKTPEGKAVSAMNAVRKGAFANPDKAMKAGPFTENSTEFEEARQDLLDSLDPQTAAEHLLARNIWRITVRILRLERCEVPLLEDAATLADHERGYTGSGEELFNTYQKGLSMILKWNATRDPHAMDLADEPGLVAEVDKFDYVSMCMMLSRTKAAAEFGLAEEDTHPTTAEGWKEAFTQVVDKSFDTPESLTAWLGHQLSEVQRESQPARDFAIRVGAGRLVTKIDDLVKSEAKLSKEFAKAYALYYDVVGRRPSTEDADK